MSFILRGAVFNERGRVIMYKYTWRVPSRIETPNPKSSNLKRELSTALNPTHKLS